MSKRDFLAMEDWTPDAVEELLALAARIKRGEVSGGLDRKVLADLAVQDPAAFAKIAAKAKAALENPA